MMKNKMLSIMLVVLVVCLAMAAPAMAQVDWDNISDGGTTVVDYAESIGRMEIFGGSTLLIEAGADISQSTSQDSYLGGAAGETGSGTFIQTGGSFTHGDDLKCTDGGAATYKMQGGSTYIPGYLETDAACLFEFSGGSFICGVEDGEQVRDSGGTFRVIGNGATLIQFDSIGSSAANYEFVPNAAGNITPITSGDTQHDTLLVDCNDLTGPATMTLFQGGWVDPYDVADVTITKDGTPLTEGTAGSLLVNEYSIEYVDGVGTAGEGLVLSVNVANSGRITADPLGYQFLSGGTKTVPMTAEVRNFDDGLSLHSYSYSIAAGSPTPTGAAFGTIVESNETATGVDLSADVTFTAAGDYKLEVEVDDDGTIYVDTIDVTVYADCAAAKAADAYDDTAARTIGDTNFDCEVNLVDFAAIALNWLDNVSY